MEAWFVSDLHLKKHDELNYRKFLKFLQTLESKHTVGHLILLGDIFDFWVGPSEYFYRKYQYAVDAILTLKMKGWKITYIEGNHDFHIRSFWVKRGVDVPLANHLILEFDGKKIRVEHGDFINPNDISYLKYRKFIRSNMIQILAHILPGYLINKLGDYLSQKSRKRSSRMREDNEVQMKVWIRNYTMNEFEKAQFDQNEQFDVMIAGHMHLRDEWSFEKGGKFVSSFNLGTWLWDRTHISPQVLYWNGNTFQWVEFNNT